MTTKPLLQLVTRDQLLTKDLLREFLQNSTFIAFKFLQPEKIPSDDAAGVIERCGLKQTRSGSYKWKDGVIACFKIGNNRDNMYVVIGPKDETHTGHTYWDYTDPYGYSPMYGPANVTYPELQRALSRRLAEESEEAKDRIVRRVMDEIEAGNSPAHAHGESSEYEYHVPRFASLQPPAGAAHPGRRPPLLQPPAGGGVDEDRPDRVTRPNNDGAPMKPGKGGYGQTLFCGQYKKTEGGKVLKNCFAGKYPHDARCGPDDGFQCIACQIEQDRMQISEVSLENCHETFLDMFKLKLTAGNVNMVVNDHRYRPEFNVNHNVCKDALNANRSCKVVFATALEMLEEFCTASEKQFELICIHTATLGVDACRCHVDMSCVPPIKPPDAVMRGAAASRAKLQFSVLIDCVYYTGPTVGHILGQEGWDGSHVKCRFQFPKKLMI